MLEGIVIALLLFFGAKYAYERATGKLTSERAQWYKQRIFGIHPALLATFLIIIGDFGLPEYSFEPAPLT